MEKLQLLLVVLFLKSVMGIEPGNDDLDNKLAKLEKSVAILDGKLKRNIYTGRVMKNNLVATLPKWGGNFQIEFDMLPLSYTSGDYRSILHITADGGDMTKASRLPGIWFHKSLGTDTTRSLHLSLYRSPIRYHDTIEQYKLQQWINVKVKQIELQDNKACSIQLLVNEELLWTESWAEPCVTYNNAKVYVGNPWYHPADAVISNLQINKL